MSIAQTVAEAQAQVERLVERFARNLDAYRRAEYKEAQVRAEFIDPFFEALGWDVRNIQGYAEQYKDVVHEDALKMGGWTEAPDYCFRIGGTRKFFLEAKKPSVSVRADVGPAYQLRRYAWSAKLPLSILTDFEEFAVYDCLRRPGPADGAAVGRVSYVRFEDYAGRFGEIYDVFARESVLRGSFDRYVQDTKGKRGTSEVDAEFLQEIESWRDLLARNIAMRNPALSVHELNFSVQHTIDRILFLRMAEDRGIEPYGRLLGLCAGPAVYPRLVDDLYRQADEKYNSGLFDFRTDTLTRSLAIDDKVLRPILAGLYYPDCPYEFSVLPVEVLGQVYEQFLGKVIRLTAGHHAVVEEKPEVKKAGGVYYTPGYIVDYIVKQTVGRLVEGKSPRELVGAHGRAPLRVLDPACGSGSFLLGAYQYLLDHYRRWYEEHDPVEHARGKQPEVYQGPHGEWRLTGAEKKRILLDHIYGVDIDRQAVEVTKLSLLLKVLEGETDETLGQQLGLWRERALPDLGNNIKCGNSLIGPDYFAGQLLPDEEETRRVNPFDWQREFPEAMASGGFDAVIGNPPYVRSIHLKKADPLLWNLYRERYRAASSREWDIYLIFVERGLGLVRTGGKLGYILPNKFLNSQVGANLRAILSEGHHLEKVVHFGALQVFPGVTTYTCLLFLSRNACDTVVVARYRGALNQGEACPLPEASPDLWAVSDVSAAGLNAEPWEFAVSQKALLAKLRAWPALGDAASIFQGTGTRADKVYLMESRGVVGDMVRVYSSEKEKEYLLERAFLKPALRGRSIGRYHVTGLPLLLVVPYMASSGKTVIVGQDQLSKSAPRLLEYLRECKPRLDQRENGRFKGEGWYCFGRPQNLDRFEVPEKIVLPDVANRGACFLDREAMWLLDTAYAIALKPGVLLDLRYILAILNSPILTYFLKETGTALRGGYFRMKTAYLNPFPLRTINFDDPADAGRHDRMVALVERMLELHKKLAAASIPADKELYQRQIEATDRQIDALVYELYGLTEEEIAIVESAGRS